MVPLEGRHSLVAPAPGQRLVLGLGQNPFEKRKAFGVVAQVRNALIHIDESLLQRQRAECKTAHERVIDERLCNGQAQGQSLTAPKLRLFTDRGGGQGPGGHGKTEGGQGGQTTDKTTTAQGHGELRLLLNGG